MEVSLLTVRELADRLRVSVRHVWSLHSAGKIPAPVRLGRSVRWVEASIDDWLKAGAPDRVTWERRATEARL